MAKIPKRRNGFYYLDEKRIFPSVTTILSVINKPQLIGWAAKEAARAALANPELSEQEAAGSIYGLRNKAGDRGRTIHSFCEMYQAKAKIDIEKMPEEFKGFAKAFVSWIESFKPEITHRETEVFSDQHEYAGTLDIILKDNSEKNWLVDIKTSKDCYPEMALQLEAYKIAVEEMKLCKIDKTAVLLLANDGSFKFIETIGDFDVFLACKTLFLWKDADKYLARIPKEKKGGKENE